MSREEIIVIPQPHGVVKGVLHQPDETKTKTKTLVVIVHGFMGPGVSSRRFSRLAAELAARGIASFRFDAVGTGMSLGDFRDMTVARRASELAAVTEALRARSEGVNLAFVAQSLGACVLGMMLWNAKWEPETKFVLLSPATNQRELKRYSFAQRTDTIDGQTTTWGNYRGRCDEVKFQEDCALPQRRIGSQMLSSAFYLESREVDYGELFGGYAHGLWIHGDADALVPRESVNGLGRFQFLNVSGGDHELERDELLSQWLQPTVEWISA